jgi:hypothetical protein
MNPIPVIIELDYVIYYFSGNKWHAIKGQMCVTRLRETLSTFQVTSEELRKCKQKDEKYLLQCQQSCEVSVF